MPGEILAGSREISPLARAGYIQGMSGKDAISHWIRELKRGNAAAAEAIWERYFPQLVRLARERLGGVTSRMADEEDVALSVLDSFCRAAQGGRFPDLADRDGLWRLLFQKTVRKAIDLARHERRQVRGGGQVHHESGLRGAGSADDERALEQVAGEDLAPDLAALIADECRRLLDRLDPDLQQLALAKMEGYSHEEIARQAGRSTRTIERRLQLIRRKWEEEPQP
jgi:DNA-directed RNA polymerase specialized sigma24 family protein